MKKLAGLLLVVLLVGGSLLYNVFTAPKGLAPKGLAPKG